VIYQHLSIQRNIETTITCTTFKATCKCFRNCTGKVTSAFAIEQLLAKCKVI